MLRPFLTFLVGILLVLAATSQARSQEQLEELFPMLAEARENDDWPAIQLVTERIQAHPEFAGLEKSLRGRIHLLEGMARYLSDDWASSREPLETSMRLIEDAERPTAVYYIALVEMSESNWVVAADWLNRLSGLSPETYSQNLPEDMIAVADGLYDVGDFQREALFLRKAMETYSPQTAWFGYDGLIERQIAVLIDQGDIDGAFAYVERVIDPEIRQTLRSHIYYQPLWEHPRFNALTDPAMGAAARVDRLPPPLEFTELDIGLVFSRHQSLIMSGDFVAAEALGRAALDRVNGGLDYVDPNEWLLWLRLEQAYLLNAIGKFDEANQIFNGLLTEYNYEHVGVMLNYASQLAGQGQHQEALELMSSLVDSDLPNAFGSMWRDSLIACSRHALGEMGQANSLMASMKARWQDNAEAYQRALLCVGDRVGAVEFLVQRLNDPAHSDLALTNLQARPSIFDGSALSPVSDLIDEFQALADHPEVVAALSEVGRVEAFEGYYLSYWGAF